MSAGQRKLKAGQVPLSELASADSVKEVRTLRPCCVCQNLGNTPSMIEHGAAWYHGRCFAVALGEVVFLSLPREKTNRMMWCDIGTALMTKLLENSHA